MKDPYDHRSSLLSDIGGTIKSNTLMAPLKTYSLMPWVYLDIADYKTIYNCHWMDTPHRLEKKLKVKHMMGMYHRLSLGSQNMQKYPDLQNRTLKCLSEVLEKQIHWRNFVSQIQTTEKQ